MSDDADYAYDEKPDLNMGMRAPYTEWIIETKMAGRHVCISRSPYPEVERKKLREVRAAHPDLKFNLIMQTVTRMELNE
jgi:hypothetical protein